jgi:8-oxo-dGTP pyrophosphatase MutT (NUDIX family)
MFTHFITQLSNRLSAPLPGEEAQYLMAPGSRRRLTDDEIEAYNPRKSAVLILIFPENNHIKTIFIVRPTYKGVHSGQVAFPGGKFEESDSDLQQTALRETFEEVGVHPSLITIIGKLTDVYIDPSNFLVHPYVGYVNARPNFIADAREVAKIIDYNLFDLHNEAIQSTKEITIAETFQLTVPCYDIHGETLWGATAMMVSELNALTKELNIPGY